MHGSTREITPSGGSVPERIAHGVPEIAQLLGGVSERYVWTLIEAGDLESFTVGRRRMVRRTAIDEFIDRLTEDERKVRAAARERVA
jgi:excisionase family DNA binding protein